MSRQEKEQKLEEEKKKRDTKFAQGVTMRDLQRCDFKIKLKNSRQDMYRHAKSVKNSTSALSGSEN